MSREAFEQRCRIAEQCVPESPFRHQLTRLHDEMLETLQSMQGEAAGEVLVDDSYLGNGERHARLFDDSLPHGTKLYTQPQSHGVPEGYVLVPVEPTEEMISEAIDAGRIDEDDVVNIWQSMLTASGKGE